MREDNAVCEQPHHEDIEFITVDDLRRKASYANWYAFIYLALLVALAIFCICAFVSRDAHGQQQPPPPIYQWQGNVPAYRQVYPEPAWFYPPAPRQGPALGPWKFPIARAIFGIPPYRQQRGRVVIPGQPPQQPYPQQPPQQDPGGSAYYP